MQVLNHFTITAKGTCFAPVGPELALIRSSQGAFWTWRVSAPARPSEGSTGDPNSALRTSSSPHPALHRLQGFPAPSCGHH